MIFFRLELFSLQFDLCGSHCLPAIKVVLTMLQIGEVLQLELKKNTHQTMFVIGFLFHHQAILKSFYEFKLNIYQPKPTLAHMKHITYYNIQYVAGAMRIEKTLLCCYTLQVLEHFERKL